MSNNQNDIIEKYSITNEILNKIKDEEGWRAEPYIDTEGHKTIGYGFKLSNLTHTQLRYIIENEPPKEEYEELKANDNMGKYIINIERKRTDYYYIYDISKEVANKILIDKLAKIIKQLENRLGQNFYEYPIQAREVIIDMAYQLGVEGLFKFKQMLRAIKTKRYYDAGINLKKSLMALQTPNRARRNADKLYSLSQAKYSRLKELHEVMSYYENLDSREKVISEKAKETLKQFREEYIELKNNSCDSCNA